MIISNFLNNILFPNGNIVIQTQLQIVIRRELINKTTKKFQRPKYIRLFQKFCPF